VWETASGMTNQNASREGIAAALGQIPAGVYVLTAQHEDRRMGMLTSFVQQVCFEPPMICVAIAKGRPIMPLISESRRFALCQLSDEDRLIYRKFSIAPDAHDDPFLSFELINGKLSCLPILKQAMAYLECELACHMDVEGDHDLFIGQVRGGACNGRKPQIHLRENGFAY
jgi:flavin reductase (DIM6/NTAB) family NADH-FMN oxidoreductase RutF